MSWAYKPKSHTADADNPSPEKKERRRQADLAFIAWVRIASKESLLYTRALARGWQLVAINRQLAKFGREV